MKKSFDSVSPMFLSITCSAGRTHCSRARTLFEFQLWIFHIIFSKFTEACNFLSPVHCSFPPLYTRASLFEQEVAACSPPSIQKYGLFLLQSEISFIPTHSFLLCNFPDFDSFLPEDYSSFLQA